MKAVSLRSFTAYWGALAVIAACGGSSDTQGGGGGGFATGPDATTGSSSGSSSGGSGSGNNYSSSGGSNGGSGDDSSVGTGTNGCPSSCSADADCQNMCMSPAMGSAWCCMAGTCAQASGSCPTAGDAGDNG